MNQGIKIIIIDDDEALIEAIKDSFEDKYYIEGFTSSKEAIKQLQKKKFDILLLDYYVDEMNGKAIVNEIRKTNKDLYIVLITGYGEEITGTESLEKLNIQNYFEKSGDFKKLITFIEGVIKSIDFFNNKSCTTAERLKKLRKINNLTQDDIAKYLGIGRTTVSQYESGETLPSTPNIIKLAKLYNVTTDYILCYELDVEKK
ncbi:response regulator [Clostridium pasteurianum]|uniref:Stage 0 sporulation protein A homolog n=1 Tax=Clostridium pasteurianum BC1 TaxID=86416 RepID=R4K1B3_CLOPA|nr:response regulator [Clostridium pasteurianum]AGK96363.1 response regulator with CheY-like receiver, AAA-type ATPase, and DNA-binding domains [Clostridium pasteurianum BC1]